MKEKKEGKEKKVKENFPELDDSLKSRYEDKETIEAINRYIG
ncbi:MAG: hypothetical protein ACPLXC_00900 [Candidatus Pacearchaeota archaeon]